MQKNHLLLIGINEYKSISTLTCCKKDCIDLKNILLEKFDFFKNNVIELYDVDATHKGIEDALRSYAKNLNLSDNLIIYYSGHGYYDDDSKKGYWMPYDCRNGNFNTYMKNEYIINMLNKINAKHIFLMTDSCFSRSILLTKGYAEELLLDYNESGIDGEHEFDKEYDEYQSRWALAAGVNEVDDGYEGENSPFADAVINTLKNTNADLRVGTLIEDVKKIFDSNNYQKPQGYPFKDHNHKGGEYIFKIVTDVVDYRDYNEFHNLLTHYNKNVEYLSIAHYSIKKDKIGYRLYKSHDQVTKIPYYYLLIQPGVNQNKTHEHIQVNHPEVFADNNLLVFIAKDRRLVKPERRIAHIKEKFSPLNIFYIEDFIRDNCTPDDLKQKKKYKYLQKANFVLPTYELHLCKGDEKRSIRKKEFDEFFNEWILERDEKILVLLGAAGIGKTTFAQYIADRYLYHYKKSYCIFIKCNDIIEDLNKKVAKKHNIDLYDFYEADYEFGEKDSTSKLSPTLFSMSLDAGNILLIIDGLDEVMGTSNN